MVHGFAGLELHVPVGAYAPQSSMESVVELAVRFAPDRARVLDVGCGVGSIGLAVAAERPDISLLGIDVNLTALRAARHNAWQAGVRSARFVASDLYSALRTLGFDMIVNTLPYEDPSTYDETDLEEVPHAYADDRRIFGTSLYYAPAHAPWLVLYGLAGFEKVLVAMNYEVLSAVPGEWGEMTFAARQKVSHG